MSDFTKDFSTRKIILKKVSSEKLLQFTKYFPRQHSKMIQKRSKIYTVIYIKLFKFMLD